MTQFDFDSPTTDWLKARGTARWHDVADGVIPLWVAEMDFPVAPPVQAAIQDIVTKQAYGYPRDNGLKEAWANWAKNHQGLEVDPAKVTVLPDVLTGVRLALRTFSPAGSPVVLPTPAYMPFWDVPGLIGRRIISVPMITGADGRSTFDLEGIGRAFAQGARSIILCSPYNPLGRVFTETELLGLSEVVEEHGAFVVADEIHGPLVPAGGEAQGRTVPYASVSEKAAAHSINLMSASKSWNLAGLLTAVGTLFTDENQRLWKKEVHELETEGASTVGMAANLAAFTSGQPWLDEANEYIHANAVWLHDELARELPQAHFTMPEATYLGWIDFRDYGLPDNAGTWLLKNARIRLNDGPTFGPGGEGHARINLATPRYLLVEALGRMADAVNSR